MMVLTNGPQIQDRFPDILNIQSSGSSQLSDSTWYEYIYIYIYVAYRVKQMKVV